MARGPGNEDRIRDGNHRAANLRVAWSGRWRLARCCRWHWCWFGAIGRGHWECACCASPSLCLSAAGLLRSTAALLARIGCNLRPFMANSRVTCPGEFVSDGPAPGMSSPMATNRALSSKRKASGNETRIYRDRCGGGSVARSGHRQRALVWICSSCSAYGRRSNSG
jgi:hypothetical protein